MAMSHILESKTYSAQELYTVSEAQPFLYPLKKWKRFIFNPDNGLKFQKGTNSANCAYRVLGADYIDFCIEHRHIWHNSFQK